MPPDCSGLISAVGGIVELDLTRFDGARVVGISSGC
jgi:hypothetical protein